MIQLKLIFYPSSLAIQGTCVGVQDTDPFWRDTGLLLWTRTAVAKQPMALDAVIVREKTA